VSVGLPPETKDILMDILRRAASQDRAVIEFKKRDGELHAMDITEHVAVLEDEYEQQDHGQTD
jgi:hypothetical protein